MKKDSYSFNWILFGASSGFICSYLLEHYENIIGFVDNDEDKWGKEWLGKKVFAPEYLASLDKEKVRVIISTYGHWDVIKEQLSEMGWSDEKVLIAKNDLDCITSYDFLAYCNHINLQHLIPDTLNLELSGFCNCKCIYCPFHGEVNLKEGHKGLMKWDTLNKIIEQVKDINTLTTLDVTGPGEIFINMEWFEMLQTVLNNTSIRNVYLYTNGMLLTEQTAYKIANLNADHINLEISIDGRNALENDEYRIGAKYETIKGNILEAKRIFEKSPQKIKVIITNCYPIQKDEIERENYIINSKQNHIPSFLLEDYGDLEITSQKTFFYGSSDVELSKFDKVQVRWPSKSNRCLNLFNRIAINYAGELLRCSCGHAGIEGIANVFEDNILEVWKNEEIINRARKNFIDGNEETDFCTACPGKGMGNYYILVKR